MTSTETFLRTTAWPALAASAPLIGFVLLTAGFALAVVAAFVSSVTAWTPMALVAMPLVAASALWIAGGAATALLGVLMPARTDRTSRLCLAGPETQTAILMTLCGEDPRPVARYLTSLRKSLADVGSRTTPRIFVLSDTSGAEAIALEKAALGPLVTGGEIAYRRRATNTGRKPGNIADWVEAHGDDFDFMLVLDADSRMSAHRIFGMIATLQKRPATGLLQAGITLVPGTTRFDRHQRIAARFLSPNFVRGFAAWTGGTGNYWGHNALMRVSAFRTAARLPVLPGQAPFGGLILSHDFVEAAWMRRAGWAIELDPDLVGSAERAPQTVDDFHRRDRRWCQGNLQHIRVLGEPGLHPISRFHLVSGIFSYVAAPVWVLLVAMIASGAVAVDGILPFALVAALLLVPKLCALPGLLHRARTWGRRATILRAAGSEVIVSTLLAPLVMVRQTQSILSVLAGRDCGWKSGRQPWRAVPRGALEALAGAALLGLILGAGATTSALWLAPLIVPLLGAPVLIRYLDGAA